MTQPVVGEITRGAGFWTVRSVNRDATYVVRLDPPRCTCPDHMIRRQRGLCKHLRAVQAIAGSKPTVWVGWERRDKASPWRIIARGQSWEEVTDLTLTRPQPGRLSETIVLPAGQRPIGLVEAAKAEVIDGPNLEATSA